MEPLGDYFSEIAVDVAEEDTASSTATTYYTVSSLQVARSTLESKTFHVTRRYCTFEQLRDRLTCEHPGLLIPPLPEKAVRLKVAPTRVELESRRCALQVWLGRVAGSPRAELSASPHLVAFFTLSPDAWSTHLAQSVPCDGGESASWVRALTDVAASVSGGDVLHPDYEALRQHFSKLETNLNDTLKSCRDISAADAAIQKSLADLQQSAARVAACEQGTLCTAYRRLQQCAGALLSDSSRTSPETHMRACLIEQVRYSEPLRQAFATYAATAGAAQRAEKASVARHVRLQRMGADQEDPEEEAASASGEATGGMAAEARAQCKEADTRLAEATAKLGKLDELLPEVLGTYQRERSQEGHAVLRDYALMMAQQALSNSRQWETMADGLHTPRPS